MGGLRPATPEGTPLIGRSGIDNLWLNVGHGSLGFTLACGSADLLQRNRRIAASGFAAGAEPNLLISQPYRSD